MKPLTLKKKHLRLLPSRPLIYCSHNPEFGNVEAVRYGGEWYCSFCGKKVKVVL